MDELEQKLERCMTITKETIKKAEIDNEKGEKLIKFAKDYYKDAEHYRSKKPETALEAASYAHGFIDAGVILGHITIEDYELEKQVEE